MKIAVFIKQVPDTSDVKWTKDNNIDRVNMESIINPADKCAIEAALRLKDIIQTEITAVTMGPSKSINVLEEAVAMGVDDAVLLSDSKFSGSDTCATSRVLSSFIKEKLPDVDLLLFGQSAIDGETGQTGFSTAKRLDFPSFANVTGIIELTDTNITVVSENDTEILTAKIALPCAICINNYPHKPRLPKIDGYIKSQKFDYKCYNMYDLNIDENTVGVKGSPTYVSKIYKTEALKQTKMLESSDMEGLLKEIKEAL